MNVLKKSLAIAVIFLFIGVAVAPSINSSVVKASNDNDLVAVTSQACGIQGYVLNEPLTERISVSVIGGNVARKNFTLTRQDADILKSKLDSMQAQIKNATSKKQVLDIYENVARTLDELHFLPNGLSVRDVVLLLISTGFSSHLQHSSMRLRSIFGIINLCCLFAANTCDVIDFNIWVNIATWIGTYGESHHINFFKTLSSIVGRYGQLKPLRFMNQIEVGVGSASYFTIGLLGIHAGYDFGTAQGFSGLKIVFDFGQIQALYFGSALAVTSGYYP